MSTMIKEWISYNSSQKLTELSALSSLLIEGTEGVS